ncbi:hypothetical protein [Gelidibacter salicanalis]|uniref:Uncharacterized protein n=1 Tax=Gelidibacter salicanalis TaxID=291193 RepID=A0A934KMY1_9FLAO|nr:hypothetical protein [Gelidibacter salicanalis]MBJ7882306.1 hypothetical protein [Gelidibacter salicanalis]
MPTNNSKLVIAMSESFREIFDQIIKAYIHPLNPPPHFDMIINSVLVGHLMYYSEGFYKGNLFDAETSKIVKDYIYDSNIDKIKKGVKDSWSMFYENPHGWRHEEDLRNSIIKNYIRMAENVGISKYIIQSVIQDSYDEIVFFTSPLHGSPSKMIPKQFYINCFIHPLPSLGYDDILYKACPDMVEEHSNIIFNNLLLETTNFINGFLDEIGVK